MKISDKFDCGFINFQGDETSIVLQGKNHAEALENPRKSVISWYRDRFKKEGFEKEVVTFPGETIEVYSK